jgi:hypothetical protein
MAVPQFIKHVSDENRKISSKLDSPGASWHNVASSIPLLFLLIKTRKQFRLISTGPILPFFICVKYITANSLVFVFSVLQE